MKPHKICNKANQHRKHARKEEHDKHPHPSERKTKCRKELDVSPTDTARRKRCRDKRHTHHKRPRKRVPEQAEGILPHTRQGQNRKYAGDHNH